MAETIWIIDGETFSDRAEVERLVAAGAVAEEITPEDQQAEAERQEQLRADQERERAAIDAHRAQQAYEATPEGQREAALREGSRVTLCGEEDPLF